MPLNLEIRLDGDEIMVMTEEMNVHLNKLNKREPVKYNRFSV